MKQKSNKTLSIICTTYNSDKTLQRTIDSLKNQTFQDFEFIIVDAKSTDNTLDIIKNNSEIITKYISETDKSIFDGMNKGLNISSGEWVYFIGSDDYLYNDRVLQNIFKNKFKHNTELVIGNILYSNGKIFKSFWDWRILLYCSVHHQAAFYKRRLFDENYYHTDRNYPSDYGINVGLYLKKIKHEYYDQIICVYALGGDSSNVIWERYKNEIVSRNIHLNSFLLKTILGIQTLSRFIIKKILLKFGKEIHI